MDDRAAKAERARKQLRKHREAQRLKRESRILEERGTSPVVAAPPAPAPVPMPKPEPGMPEPAPAVPEPEPSMPEPAPSMPQPEPSMPELAPSMPELEPAMPQPEPSMPDPPFSYPSKPPTDDVDKATFASELWSNAAPSDYDTFLASSNVAEPALTQLEAAPATDLFAPAPTEEAQDALASLSISEPQASSSSPTTSGCPDTRPPTTRFMEHLFAPSPQRPTAMDNYAATMEASMDQDRGADTSQREAATLFSMEGQAPSMYDASTYDEAPVYGAEEAYYGHDTYGYEQEPAYSAAHAGEEAPLHEAEFYPPYHGDDATYANDYGTGFPTFDPEQMLETMSSTVDEMGDSRTLEPIPEHESDEWQADKEEEAEAPASTVDGLFASHPSEPWTYDACNAPHSAPPNAFALEEAPSAFHEDSVPALAQSEHSAMAHEVPTVPDTAAEEQQAPPASLPDASAVLEQPDTRPTLGAERLAAELADARAQIEALRTECKALTDAKHALEVQLRTQHQELEQSRQALAQAQEQRLASERMNADRMTELQRQHHEAWQALQAERERPMEAKTPLLSAHTQQERRVSALVRAHKRSATTSATSSRLPFAETDTGDFLPRRQPSEKPRMRPDAALTPSQAHHRQASLQMLRARMASDAEEQAGPAPPTSTLSIVQDEHRVSSNVQDQVEMARTHSHQFSQDALLFCSSCQGDLIIV